MGETLGNDRIGRTDRNKAETNATAKRFGLRSYLLRANKINLTVVSLGVFGAAVAISYAAHAAATSSKSADFNNASQHEGVSSPVQSNDNPTNTEPGLNTESAGGSVPEQTSGLADPSNPLNLNANSSTTRIVVNGKEVVVPANGTYEQDSTDGSSQTKIRVHNQQQSSTSSNSSSNHSSSNINIRVQSDSPPE